MTDTNDNPPVFQDTAYSFDIPENAMRGHRVGQIAASDPDEGMNSQLTYTVISDWANDVFSLNPHTGVFTLTARLDYEEVSFQLTFLIFYTLKALIKLSKSVCMVFRMEKIIIILFQLFYKKFANLLMFF